MKIIPNAASLVLLLTLAVFPQADKPADYEYTAPIEWKAYKIPNSPLSFSMPKQPVVENASGSCESFYGKTYRAYAGQVIYEFTWRTKTDRPPTAGCNPENMFGPEEYKARILSPGNHAAGESAVSTKGTLGKMIQTETENSKEYRYFFWFDEKWIEMAVIGRKNVPNNMGRFVSSLSMDASTGEDIGDGGARTVGDRSVDSEKLPVVSGTTGTEGLVVVSKPRAGYTDLARSKKTAGSVVVKVAFLANGGIGEVTPVKELDNGLTEAVVAAAKRIVFLPARENRVPVTVVKQLEYNFSIY